MKQSFEKIMHGYHQFREKYVSGDNTLLKNLARYGQNPDVMVIACCDSRVDPALLLQCDPGDLFVVRNVANIVPPYENDEAHHGTSAALEFGVCYLHVKHLIILGHSHCAGIHALIHQDNLKQDDFISNWMNVITLKNPACESVEKCAKEALVHSYNNCLTFPWIKEKLANKTLAIHLWFFDIEKGFIYSYDQDEKKYIELNT